MAIYLFQLQESSDPGLYLHRLSSTYLCERKTSAETLGVGNLGTIKRGVQIRNQLIGTIRSPAKSLSTLGQINRRASSRSGKTSTTRFGLEGQTTCYLFWHWTHRPGPIWIWCSLHRGQCFNIGNGEKIIDHRPPIRFQNRCVHQRPFAVLSCSSLHRYRSLKSALIRKTVGNHSACCPACAEVGVCFCITVCVQASV